ncbi:glycosyltransferase family 4 protein [Gammaproteobacteria bacterium]|nr:glycosyltransferase family 4 protein [Gammaproteobacteria bacterium]
MQYLPDLASNGFKIDSVPFFDDIYLRELYKGDRSNISIIKYLFERIKKIKKCTSADLIWIEKEALPWIPWFIEGSLLPKNVPIVTDYDDAIFHRYDMHKTKIIRAMLGSKIKKIMKNSSLVISGNSYLNNYAINAGAKKTFIVPTVVDLNTYNFKEKSLDKNIARVGWIGTPQTWQELAHPIHQILSPILKKNGAIFRAIGASMESSKNDTLEIIPWTEESEVNLIQSMDIGVMPLPDNPWTRGKCGYKLIQYMACGLPVVASSVGVNCDIVENGINGFLVDNDDDWQKAIEKLLNDPDLRREMGKAGRKKIEQQFSLQTWGPRVSKMFKDVCNQ